MEVTTNNKVKAQLLKLLAELEVREVEEMRTNEQTDTIAIRINWKKV
jgi:hypothetical protein